MMDRDRESVRDDAVTPDELVARARALVPALRARQEETEATRRIPRESIDEMMAAGLYKVQQPLHYGGYEMGLDSFVRVGMEIASGCGSTGWVFSTGAQHQWQIGMYPPEAQDEVWKADPAALTGSSYAPTGTAVAADGGWRLSGIWSFCSGVVLCQWMILGVRLAPAAGADPTGFAFALVPCADYRIAPNWDVLGLVGTGSHDIVLEDVLVPAHRLLTHEQALSGRPPGAGINTGDLFKIPFFAAISTCLCTAILGTAQGALEDYVADIRTRTTRGAAISAPKGMAEFPTIQLRVGEAAAAIEAAQQLVLRDCRETMAIMAEGRPLTETERARNKGDLGYAVRLAVRAADLLFESVGGTGLYNSNRVQRAWRDIHAGAKHISMNWDVVGSLYGRIKLGLPPGPAQF
jgi:alkylation response protein AidB-like acyl-CoA dehydrogenase